MTASLAKLQNGAFSFPKWLHRTNHKSQDIWDSVTVSTCEWDMIVSHQEVLTSLSTLKGSNSSNCSRKSWFTGEHEDTEVRNFLYPVKIHLHVFTFWLKLSSLKGQVCSPGSHMPAVRRFLWETVQCVMLELVTFPHPTNWQHISCVSKIHMHVIHFHWPQLNFYCGELAFCGFYRFYKLLSGESRVTCVSAAMNVLIG